MENIDEVTKIWNDLSNVFHISHWFRYRKKADLYGPKALFGIHLHEIDENKGEQAKILRVNDQIQINREDRDFWNKNHLD